MNCAEAEVYVSALYDGEQIPASAAQHIGTCEACRSTLSEYARMAAELRLAASRRHRELPPLTLPERRSRFAFLWRRIAIPQFALVGLIACLVLAIVAGSVLRAQSRPLWFEFTVGPHQQGEQFGYRVAQAGYDKSDATLEFVNGEPLAVAMRIRVESISSDDVVLRCRAVPARLEATATGYKLLGGPTGGISLDGVASVHYKPGESLAVPVEGGGVLYIKGEVLGHQPKIAFGLPLEPAADKMVVRQPVLVTPEALVGQSDGATATANNEELAIRFNAGPGNEFTFALRPFPGAVQGEANWGEIRFKLDGINYRLLAAAPITGGDQPRPVWVRHEVQPDWGLACPRGCLGAGPIPK